MMLGAEHFGLSMKKERMFFFEKKNQKTFIAWRAPGGNFATA